MESLKITKGGKLIETEWVYDEAKKEGSYVSTDVTDQGIRHLLNGATLDEGVTLKDIFLFLNTELDIYDSIIGNWCKDIVTEGLTQPEKIFNGYNPDEIEYLELYWNLHQQAEGTYGLVRPDFHGVGWVLQQDKLFEWGEVEWPKGQRIPWGLSFTPTNELINLPLKLNPELDVYDDDHDSADWGKKLFTVKKPDFKLVDILNGVIWELSFHGGPPSRQKLRDELHEAVDKIKKEESESGS